MDLFRDDYRSLQLGKTYYYRVIAKNESGASSPSNVISIKHTQKNLAPQITLSEALTTTVDKGQFIVSRCREPGTRIVFFRVAEMN
ncbi:hypothetical protein ACUOFC_15340, partial [Escherichia sp. TWPC-MK]